LQNIVLIYSISQNNIEFYKKSLTKLQCILHITSSYIDFEKALLLDSPSVIILDLELDNTDAISVIKEIKSQNLNYQPFIIVCASNADDFIEISALNSGAHEFIDMPVNALIFESKFKALLKRTRPVNNNNSNEGLFIDHEQYKIYIGKEPHTLPRLEFKLLNLLFSHPNKIFSKDEIATEIWNNKEISSKRTIDIHIRNIRKELGEDIIKTYRGLGYSLKY